MTPTSTPSLVVKELTKSYGKTTAVKSLSMIINPGECVAFIGPNGAGKSTTMRCIAGLCIPDEGSVEIGGYNIQTESVKARHALGYVSQELELYPYLSALEFLQFIAKVRGIPADLANQRIDELLTLSSLQEEKNRLIREYSGGMMRKLAMSAALLSHASLVILDESFVGLDPESTYLFTQYIQKYLNTGGSILISSHILEMLHSMCTRFFFLVKGSAIRDLSKEELDTAINALPTPTINALYLELTGQSHLIESA